MMEFSLHTDHHLAIGHQHLSDGKPCQDHALSGVVKSWGNISHAFAVVSDGCSSGGETDIGARLVTTLTAKEFRAEGYQAPDDIWMERDAWDVAHSMGLDDSDLLATHMYAVIDRFGNGLVTVKGDGVVVFVSKSKAMNIHKFEWANNAPFYPLYGGLYNFFKVHGGKDAPALTVTTHLVETDGTVTLGGGAIHSTEDGTKGITLPISAASDLSLIVLFSDGINQVDQVDWLDAVKQLTAFPNRTGSFAKRRMIQFIKRVQKAGHGPLDDLSYAVISIAPSEVDQILNAGEAA